MIAKENVGLPALGNLNSDTHMQSKLHLTRTRPEMLYVEVFAACDMSCPMCVTLPYWEGRRRMLARDDLRERVFRPAAEMGIKRVLISGGEPSLRYDIFDVLKDAKALGFGVWFATNLMRYDEKKLRCLLSVLDSPKDTIAVSYDSFVPEEMNAIRGGDVFARVEENIQLLHGLRRKFNSQAATCAAMIVQTENRNSVNQTIDHVLGQLSFDRMQVHLRHDYKSVHPANVARQQRSDYCAEHETDLIRAGMIAFARAANDQRILVRRRLMDWVQFVKNPQKMTLSCEATRFLFVNAEGVMRSCMFGLPYADLMRVSMNDALSSDRYGEVRRFVSGCNICNLSCN